MENNRDFFNWLAGFIDGEGSFVIRKQSGFGYGTRFTIKVRADDFQIIKQIREITGFGNIVAHNSSSNKNPTCEWYVSSNEDCLRLIEILDKYPLRAKKLKDYIIWRNAVLETKSNLYKQGRDWMTMEEYYNQIKKIRQYI